MPNPIRSINFLRQVKDLQIEALQKFAAVLTHFDVSDPDSFQTIIKSATTDYGVEPAAIAEHFMVSRGTVSRWAAGKSMPHPMMRSSIIDWIRTYISAKAQSLEEAA